MKKIFAIMAVCGSLAASGSALAHGFGPGPRPGYWGPRPPHPCRDFYGRWICRDPRWEGRGGWDPHWGPYPGPYHGPHGGPYGGHGYGGGWGR